ncbi:MAG: HAD family hydrolase [Natronomonas sp.]|jgi:phosphoglycolate phosphatase|uniref:HAD family hydrolase n=1 Tax=Natronomonas sp. TaxID=2184060 RepID=UPI0028706B3D|nr:HAD family hydrolase [Natronomonas sp.]MDR9380569.1 HAD family hydrolase [Natronomonas sp.]MDR9431402.1 HAD family hydrolase [Natronomonas sp.]
MTTAAYDRWAFDLDGTIVDVDPDYVHDLLGRVGDRLGYGFTDRQAEILWHGFDGRRSDHLDVWGVDPERFWTVFHDEEDPEARAEATFLHEDAAAVGDLDAPTVLVTHCQRYLTEPVLETLDIGDWFDAVVCCTAETGWKPDPRPVRSALSAAGARSGSGVLVGDSPQDVGAAWNAGLDAAHVERHGHERRGCCVVGDHRVDRLDELLRS